MAVHCFYKNLAVVRGFYFYNCTAAIASTPTMVRISTNYTVIGHLQDTCGFPLNKLDIMLSKSIDWVRYKPTWNSKM